jgi:hypothetical protein
MRRSIGRKSVSERRELLPKARCADQAGNRRIDPRFRTVVKGKLTGSRLSADMPAAPVPKSFFENGERSEMSGEWNPERDISTSGSDSYK